MARKRYKRKARTCTLCRPWKRGLAIRWSNKDLVRLKEFEKARSRGDWGSL